MNLPPPATPKVLQQTKQCYRQWFLLYRDFPRTHRYTLGAKIEEAFLALLEHIFFALYLSPEKKVPRLEHAIAKCDSVKFFLQIAWETRCLNEQKYLELSEHLQEIGRMLGGWRKGVEAKLQK